MKRMLFFCVVILCLVYANAWAACPKSTVTWLANNGGVFDANENWECNSVPGLDEDAIAKSGAFLFRMRGPCRIHRGNYLAYLTNLIIGDYGWSDLNDPCDVADPNQWWDPNDPNSGFINQAKLDIFGGTVKASYRILIGSYEHPTSGVPPFPVKGILNLENAYVSGITEVGRNGEGELNIYSGIYEAYRLGLGYVLGSSSSWPGSAKGTVNLYGGTLLISGGDNNLFINSATDSKLWIDGGIFKMAGDANDAIQSWIDSGDIDTHAPNGLIIRDDEGAATDYCTIVTCDWGADLDKSGEINMIDFSLLAADWLKEAD